MRDSLTESRRELLTRLANTLLLFGLGTALGRCGLLGGDDTSERTFTSTVVSGHSHTLTLSAIILASPPANGFSGNTSSAGDGHVHEVDLTQAELQDVAAHQSFTVTTANVEGHEHQFTFS